MTLTAIAILCVGALALAGGGDGAWRGRLAGIGAAWFVALAVLAGAGLFTRTGQLGIIALGASVAAPIVAGWMVLARAPRAHFFARAIPLSILVGVHVGRLLGGFFLALYQAGRLPATFAWSAGSGDLLVGLTALPLAWAIHRRMSGWRPLTLAWNVLATLDLVSALSFGIGSAANSPVRFIFERPDSGAVGMLPWALIPGFLVPMYMLTHIVIFVRLAAQTEGERQTAMDRAA
jgi:hypothetical protein